MRQRVKVLQLHPDYNIKTQDFADLGEQIIKALPVDEFETTTGFLHGHPLHGEPESRAEHSVYFGFSVHQAKGFRFSVMRKIYRFCRDTHFDVVICNRFKPVNIFLRLNPWLKIPLCIGIVHGFGDYDRLTRRLETRLLINERWRLVGVSPAVKEYLLGLNCGFTERNSFSITNAIDIDSAMQSQLPRHEARACLGLPEDAFVFGAIGRLVPVKGHINLINAFAKVREAMPRSMLIVIGEGRSRNELEAVIRRHGLQNIVLLPGMLPNAQKYARAFDIFVMPSYKEGLGLVILEAMSAGLPVIASDIPAVSPILRAAGGHLVAPGNEEMLAAGLLQHFQHSPERRFQMGQRALDYLQTHHAIEDYRNQYLQLIRHGNL
jgi:glycosyltransferase involved in cell wall biosynthesis